MYTHTRLLSVLLVAVLGAACGGGNGNNKQPPPPPIPAEPVVTVAGDIKKLIFSWTESEFTDYYRVLENPDGHSGFTQVGDNIPAETLTVDRNIAVHQLDWVEAQYLVEACNVTGCSSSDVVTVTDVMLDTIGYIKSTNTDSYDRFGRVMALSADGTTLAVGSSPEASAATGVDGDQADNSAAYAGAVYVLRFEDGRWSHQAYIKASNANEGDWFGDAIALSADGNTLAVGARLEGGASSGIDGDQTNPTYSGNSSGAVYLFRFAEDSWKQQAYIKASNTGVDDQFGSSVDLSADGNTLAVGAPKESSNSTGIDGDQVNNLRFQAGAAFLFRFENDAWYQQAYIKASYNSFDQFGDGARFGNPIALSADGSTLVVGALLDNSNATGINGDQTDNSIRNAGAVHVFQFETGSWYQEAYVKASINTARRFGHSLALSGDGATLAVAAGVEDGGVVYLFRRVTGNWSQEAYVEASNTDWADNFGTDVSLNADGNMLAVSASTEDSIAVGINGDQFNESGEAAGAAYLLLFENDAWHHRTYIKASTNKPYHFFGGEIDLSSDGLTLAVGAEGDSSSATGVDGDQMDEAAPTAGAVFIY